MADGYFPTLVSKDNDQNAVANPIFVELSDGTTAATFTGTSLNVNITGGATGTTQYAEDTAHVSGDMGVECLTVRRDTPASGTSADGDYATLNTDANGRLYVNIFDGGNSITVDGTVTVTATDLDIRDLTHVSDSVKVGDGTDFLAVNADGSINITDNGGSLTVDATNLDIRDLTSVSDSVSVLQATHDNLNANANIQVANTDVSNANPVPVSDAGGSLTVDGTVTVTATDLDIRDLTLAQDAVKVSANTSANSFTNPIFVQNVKAVITGEVNDYSTASAVASGGTSNHDYTVTNTMKLSSIIFACSGKGKVEVQCGPVASLVTKAVAFVTTNTSTVQLTFDPPIEVPSTSTGTVRLIRTNRENQAQDLYSTIIGVDN